MKREDLRQAYYDLTAKVSDITRQLALAGIALVWLFKSESHGRAEVPHALLLPATFAVIALALDLTQYLYASAAWGIFNRLQERRDVSPEAEFSAPPAMNWPTLVFFWSKVAFVVLAYWRFLTFFWSIVATPNSA
jgi:hypothetical protein